MGKPAAKRDDEVVAVDTHIVMIPSPAGPVPTPLPAPFAGKLGAELSEDVLIEHKAAATVGSGATNDPQHVPSGGSFQQPPTNRGTVETGSGTVLINHKKAARSGDAATTCDDLGASRAGVVIASGSVLVGD
ncbi:MAG: PAAR domain-containing protein [Myxococcales bacterium]|nr:PAAR domain-containing protein [Myxococcales bacterium]